MEIHHQDIHNLKNPLIVDVRSPDEYQEDHIPHSINLPVLTNEQRDRVGTLYHQESTFKARKLGAREICKNLPEILEEIENRSDRNRPVIVYCWRGGMRSESLSMILNRIGYDTYRLEGGYKSYRKTVHDYLKNARWGSPLITIYGLTGSGKTKLLHEIRDQGGNVLDLEDAANHRGSAFGSIGKGPQPSQKQFERDIYRQLKNVSSPIYLEGESRHIGAVRIPNTLFDELADSPNIWLETDLDRRVKIIQREYDWPESRATLVNELNNLRERLGNNRIDQLQEFLRNGKIRTVIRALLTEYYDPAYRRSCPSKEEYDRIVDGNNIQSASADIQNWTTPTSP